MGHADMPTFLRYGAVSATFDPDAKLPPLHVVTRYLTVIRKHHEIKISFDVRKEELTYVPLGLRTPSRPIQVD